MTARLYTGQSGAADLETAVTQASRAALAPAVNPALAVVLATDGYEPEALAKSVARALGPLPWVGCSSAAVFAGETLLREGIVVGVIDSDQAYVGVGAAGPASKAAHAAGAAAVARALDQLPARAPSRSRALLVFLNALNGQAAQALRGAVQEGGTAFAWAGGGAGDNLRYVRTAQFARGRAYQDNVVIAAIDLPGPLASEMRHGWHAYGPPTMVTRSSGSLAIELEYEPAFEVYRRTALTKGDIVGRDDFAAFAMLHPLGIPQADGEHIIRDPIEVCEDGSLRCICEVPDGSLVRVMQASQDSLIEAARQAAQAAARGVGGVVGGALVFDCVSRFLVLGPRMQDELSALRQGLGEDVPMMGCLTFGEVGALGAGLPQFNNKTCVVLALPGRVVRSLAVPGSTPG